MRSFRKISENITYTEATKSVSAIKYGIDNTPDESVITKMEYVAENVFEKVRAKFKVPIAVTSFFRSAALNARIGGSSTSQHVLGEAMDLDADVYGMLTNREIFDYIKDCLDFDQLIWEFGDDKEPDWVHVSLTDGYNKKEILVAYKKKEWGKLKTKYKYYEG